ncbi:9287_t:CDS:1, partial [Funneliformis geosporum]
IPPSNNNNNNNNKADEIPENSSSTKDRSKLLDPDEYLEDDDMEEDLKDFTVVTKATPFAVATHIKFTPKEKNNSKIILAINNVFAQNDDFRGVSIRLVNLTRSVIVYFATSDVATAALHVTIPDLKIDTFFDFSQYKADMQFNERTIHVTDIPLQMKPANIKQ